MALRIDDVDLTRDRALVDAYQAGSQAAFEDLYRRYFDRLRRFCMKRVHDPLDAEEIAQEAFARAYRAMPTFAGERRFYPWLTVIASRLCVDHHRRLSRSEPSADVELGSVEGGQEAVFEKADVEMLDLALKRLLPRHREVLDLREREGWSYKRIAEHYDVSLATVEMLIFRARQALRREFIAVAGDDRRYAAGIPVVAWLARRTAAMRTRVAEWLPVASGPIFAPVLSAAIVAGSVAVFTPGPTAAPSDVAIDRRPVPVATVADIDPTVPVSGTAGNVPHASAPRTSAAAPEAAPRAAAVLQRTTAADGRDFASDAPVATGAGPVAVGLDPIAVKDGTVATVDAYVDQTTEPLGWKK